jgi:hypothetical protein
VKWRRENAGLHFAAAALGIEEEQAIEEFNFAGRTYTLVEILKVGAATEGYVLAVVDVFAVGQNVGGRAAAQERTLLKQPDLATRLSQRDAGRQTRQPAANHDHTFQG